MYPLPHHVIQLLFACSKRAENQTMKHKFRRGEEIQLKKITDKKLKGKLKHTERQFKESAAKAAKICDWLLTEESGHLEAEGKRHFSNHHLLRMCVCLL